MLPAAKSSNLNTLEYLGADCILKYVVKLVDKFSVNVNIRIAHFKSVFHFNHIVPAQRISLFPAH